jgi:hypothetical protein
MRLVAIVLLSIATAAAADKDKSRFVPGPASSYPGHQTLDQITIAAVPFTTDEQARTAFDKVNPYKYGVLPVLVILENGTGKALRLDLVAELVDPEGRHIDATPAVNIAHLADSPKAPKLPGQNPLPFPPKREKKGPLNIWEIEGRAFAAKMLPEKDEAHGFFYFQTEYRRGSRLYINGLKDPATGKDYFYFEVPFEKE